MKSLSNINFVYHVVLLIDRRTHIPSLVMMLKLGKKISVENQSVLSIYIELGYRYDTVTYSCQTFILPLYEHLVIPDGSGHAVHPSYRDIDL